MFNDDFQSIRNRAIEEDDIIKSLFKKKIISNIRNVEVILDKIYFIFVRLKSDYEPILQFFDKPVDAEAEGDDVDSDDDSEGDGSDDSEGGEGSHFSLKNYAFYNAFIKFIKIFFHTIYFILQPFFFFIIYIFDGIYSIFNSMRDDCSLYESRQLIILKRTKKIDIHEFVTKLDTAFNDYFLLRRNMLWMDNINNIDLFFNRDYTFIQFTDRLKDYIRKRKLDVNYPSLGKGEYGIDGVLEKLDLFFEDYYWYFNSLNKKLKDYRLMISLRKYVAYNLIIRVFIRKCNKILAKRYIGCRNLSIKFFDVINHKLE